MGFLTGLVKLPFAVVADVATLGGTCTNRRQSFTEEALDHITGNDPESKLDRSLARAEKAARIRALRDLDGGD